ncbi:MAG: cytochrome b/b6 domain-containing protein [Giesbergeria sp.]
MAHTVRIWDLPTRVFHWTLFILVVSLVATANIGGNAMVWHMRAGYCVLTLLLFRVIWGVIGGRWSRFGTFLYAPKTLLRYLRGQFPEPAGHNPLGALSVFALLAALALQASAGLFSDDEIAFSGPLTSLVSSQRVDQATWYHTEVGKVIVIALVVLHLVAIAFYTVRKRKDLVPPMVTGDKLLDAPTLPSRDDALTRTLALVVLGVCAGAVTWLVRLGG